MYKITNFASTHKRSSVKNSRQKLLLVIDFLTPKDQKYLKV